MILVISPKNVYVAKKIKRECRMQSVECRILDIQDLVARNFKVDVKKYNVLYIRNAYLKGSPKYLPNIIKLAKQFKKAGKKVVDLNITNGKIGQGKWVDYKALKKAHLLIPKTSVLSHYPLSTTHYPLILKWVYGFKARNVFLIQNQKQFDEVFGKYPKEELLVQEFVKAEYEYKVITVGYKALPVVSRFKILDSRFKINFAKHTTIKAVAIPKVTKLAEKAAQALGRELAKVDILEAKGELYILEVNRFPGLDSFEELTKYNVIRDFLKYLQK